VVSAVNNGWEGAFFVDSPDTTFSAVAEIPILLGMRTTLFFTLLVFAGQAGPGRAQYGWPPANYSVTGVRACDDYHYRNLRQVLHDHGCGRHLRELRARITGGSSDVDGPPAQLYAPLTASPGQADLLPLRHPAAKQSAP